MTARKRAQRHPRTARSAGTVRRHERERTISLWCDLRQPGCAGSRCGHRHRPCGRGAGLLVDLDGRGDRDRCILASGCRGPRCPWPRSGHRHHSHPAARAHAGGHDCRHPAVAQPRARRAGRTRRVGTRHSPPARRAAAGAPHCDDARVRGAAARVPERRIGDLRGRLLAGAPIPPRHAARRAPTQHRARSAQPADAAVGGRGGRRRPAQLPARFARPQRGSRGAQGRRRADHLLRPRRGGRTGALGPLCTTGPAQLRDGRRLRQRLPGSGLWR